MCLLLVHHRARADAPLVLLANRDEDHARGFDPPTTWPGPDVIVAPRDRRAGGTWLGLNASGLVVAITNRPAPRGTDVRSRGLLVADVLRHGDAAAADAWLAVHLRDARYDPFNLLVVDRDRGFVLHHESPAGRESGRGTPAPRIALTPGVHVLTNLHDLDVAPVPATGLPRTGEPLAALVARLEAVAGDRETPLPGDHRICKVGRTRGTVCSAVIALPADRGARPTFRFANGPPHLTPFSDVRV
jgi:hypothetical protein